MSSITSPETWLPTSLFAQHERHFHAPVIKQKYYSRKILILQPVTGTCSLEELKLPQTSERKWVTPILPLLVVSIVSLLREADDGAPAGNDDNMAENGDREGDSSKSNRSHQAPEPPPTATATTSPKRETSSRGQMQPGIASFALEASADVGQGQPGADVGGEGGSRAWVGSVRRRDRRKSVLRVDGDSGALRSFRCSAMDDKIELL